PIISFGWTIFALGLVSSFTNLVNANIVMKMGIEKPAILGLFFMFLGGCSMFLLYEINVQNWFSIVLPVAFYRLGAHFVFANTLSSALSPFAHQIGIATALFGFIQVLGAGVASSIIAIIPEKTSLPLAILIMCLSAFALMLKVCVRSKCSPSSASYLKTS
ncbi:MAG: hypothetical protein ACTSXG_00255, partial [Alphaproteobacteria bacterium]